MAANMINGSSMEARTLTQAVRERGRSAAFASVVRRHQKKYVIKNVRVKCVIPIRRSKLSSF